MNRIALALAAVGAAALLASASLSVVAAEAGKAEVATSGAMLPTAGKAGAKTTKKSAAKSCGTYKYPDKKTGKCLDARDKKK